MSGGRAGAGHEEYSGRSEPGGEGPGGEGPGRLPDRADYDPDHDPSAPVICELCGGEMVYTASCKLKCPRCGYMRDCSDP